MESACFTTHPSRDTTRPSRDTTCPSLFQRFRPPPTGLVFPVMVLRAALHQLHHDLLVLLLLQIQLFQFSLLILYTPPLNYSPTCEQSCFFGFLVPHPPAACAHSGPHAEKKIARGGRRSPNRADSAQHGAVSCCAHCVRAVHRISCVGVSYSLFLFAVPYTRVRRRELAHLDGPQVEPNFACGARRSPNRADIAQHGAVSCCAHCVRAVHRSSWVGVSYSLFCSLCRTPVYADGSSLILTGRR